MSLVALDEQDGIAALRLNRPEKRNALNIAMFVALDEALAQLEHRIEQVGVVVLRAVGPVFCAGADLGPREEGPLPNFQARTITRLAALPVPVVAAVHGDCLTGGLELILAADIIVASETAHFADTHARWGVMPEWGMTQRLPRRIGPHRAALMSFSGRRVAAREAERWGLVDLVASEDAFAGAVDTLAAEIAAQSRHSLRGYKRLFRETADLPLGAGLAWEIAHSPGKAPDFAARVSGRFGR
ncbi:MAG: enoyl-CoA hydratase/isomerase family protein [Sphingomonadales bacterium]|nr:MAG: enoyl-CoA hydratase/isomerase family protein [Sphingomonadales bacterium]